MNNAIGGSKTGRGTGSIVSMKRVVFRLVVAAVIASLSACDILPMPEAWYNDRVGIATEWFLEDFETVYKDRPGNTAWTGGQVVEHPDVWGQRCLMIPAGESASISVMVGEFRIFAIDYHTHSDGATMESSSIAALSGDSSDWKLGYMLLEPGPRLVTLRAGNDSPLYVDNVSLFGRMTSTLSEGFESAELDRRCYYYWWHSGAADSDTLRTYDFTSYSGSRSMWINNYDSLLFQLNTKDSLLVEYYVYSDYYYNDVLVNGKQTLSMRGSGYPWEKRFFQIQSGSNIVEMKASYSSFIIDDIKLIAPPALINDGFETGDLSKNCYMVKSYSFETYGTHSGTYRLRIPSSQPLSIPATFERAGVVKLWVKYEYHDGYNISVYIDDVEALQAAVGWTWTELQVPITAGVHTVKIVSSRNDSSYDYYIDDLSFE
jgi:hypothetical protein